MPTMLEKLKMLKELKENNDAELREMADPTQDMSGKEKFLAGVGRGMHNIGRNVGNMVGLVDDEELARADELDAPLMDTGAGKVGSFTGEMTALAPMGVGGRALSAGAKALSKVRSAPAAVRALGTALPRATGRGTTGLATAATEGAVAGSILSDPEDRLEGALTGALAGGALNKTIGALGRKVARGANKSDGAKRLGDLVEEQLGRRPNIPVGQAAKGLVKYPYRSVISQFPLARVGSQKLQKGVVDDWSEAVIAKAFGKDAAARKTFRDTGSFAKAVRKALKDKGSKAITNEQAVLKMIADEMKEGDKLTAKMLDQVAKTIKKGKKRPFYDLTSAFDEVMSEALEESTVAGRKMFHDMAGMGAGAGALVAPTATAGVLGGTWAAGRPLVQKTIMGDSFINKGADAIGGSASPYAAALRNRISGGQE